jgi:hypothetical protein
MLDNVRSVRDCVWAKAPAQTKETLNTPGLSFVKRNSEPIRLEVLVGTEGSTVDVRAGDYVYVPAERQTDLFFKAVSEIGGSRFIVVPISAIIGYERVVTATLPDVVQTEAPR